MSSTATDTGLPPGQGRLGQPAEPTAGLPPGYQADIDIIGRIEAVPTILEVVCQTTGMGFAAVARVTDDRWIACGVKDDIGFGLKPGGELVVETTICNDVRTSRRAVIIDHVAEDPAFAAHNTPFLYGFQSYISMPIVLRDGRFFGTLCSIDPRPARLNRPEVVNMFKLFADLIAFHVDAGERIRATESELVTERHTAELREQFLAVLGHDLRNPLASIDSGIRLLARHPKVEDADFILAGMRSSVGRMTALIADVLDFAKARLGGGLTVERVEGKLGTVVEEIVSEFRRSTPGREIIIAGDRSATAAHDPLRIGQLLANLIGNALAHGAKDGQIIVSAGIEAGIVELSVANAGEPISPAVRDSMFKPFVRAQRRGADEGHRSEGLGLGLYIASEIARAHGGALTVNSEGGETRFTFRMPAR